MEKQGTFSLAKFGRQKCLRWLHQGRQEGLPYNFRVLLKLDQTGIDIKSGFRMLVLRINDKDSKGSDKYMSCMPPMTCVLFVLQRCRLNIYSYYKCESI